MRTKRNERKAIGANCRRCGADDWYLRQSGRACVPCNNGRVAAHTAANPERRRAYGQRWHRERRTADPVAALVSSARSRAKIKGVPFAITAEHVRALWPENGQCPACGVAMKMAEARATTSSFSLDRVVPALGYVPGNVAVICMGCNTVKSTYSAAQLDRLIDWLRGAEAGQAFYSAEVT